MGGSNALVCDKCHGSDLSGQGIAPSCATCHANPGPRSCPVGGCVASAITVKSTGLVASVVSITPAGTTPTVVKFTLKDDAGLNVDVTGAGLTGGATKNWPLSLAGYVVNSDVDAAGNLQQFRGQLGGNPGSVTYYPNITAMSLTSGTLPVAGSFQYAAGSLTQGATTCTVAAPCLCTAAAPCVYSGKVGFQAGKACTAAAPCTCTSTSPCGPALPAADGAGMLTYSGGTYTFTYGQSTYATTPQSVGVAVSGLQGATTCTAAAPCTCTLAAPCTCTAAVPCNISVPNAFPPASFPAVTTGTRTFGHQGTVACTPDNVCTCTVANPCTADLLSNVQTLWIAAFRKENLTNSDDGDAYRAVNFQYNFASATGAAVAAGREIVKDANCNACHDGFRAKASVAATFHSGARIAGTYCNICHYDQRGSSAAFAGGATVTTGNAEARNFVHRIHFAEKLTQITSGTQTKGYQGETACGTGLPTGTPPVTVPVCTCTVANPCSLVTFHGIEATFPQDVRNCDGCHGGAAQGSQHLTNPSRSACGSCHDAVSFVSPAAAGTTVHGAKNALLPSGAANPLYPAGTAYADDSSCASCHGPAAAYPVASFHFAVLRPDSIATYFWPNQTSFTAGTGWTQGATICTDAAPCTCTAASACVKAGTSANTNASYIAAANALPTGVDRITYQIQSASLNASRNPVVVFKFQQNGTDVVFQANTNPELMANFVGAPSIYFVYAAPQDGIAAPSDFNGSASAYLKDLWKGNLTVTVQKTSGTDATTAFTGKNAAGATVTTNCSGANGPCVCTVRNACSSTGAKVVPGTLTGPNASGFYTATLTGSVVPAGSVMMYGGVGYSYSLSSTQPLTQIASADPTFAARFPYNATNRTGGISVPAPDVYIPVSASDVRRNIVTTARCNSCHAQLGVGPTFHAGQRNDAPTCSWCHKPNQTSNGWSASSATFIHGIHGAEARGSVDFLWHATCNYTSPVSYQAPNGTCTTDGTNTGTVVAPKTYGPEVGYPGYLADCEQCHVAGAFSFANADSKAEAPNMLWSTVGAGTYAAAPAQNPAVALAVNYGLGYAINNYTGDIVNADATTLVSSPLAAACSSCHADANAAAHITAAGGTLYTARGAGFVAAQEGCLDCHGAGKGIVGIDSVHQ